MCVDFYMSKLGELNDTCIDGSVQTCLVTVKAMRTSSTIIAGTQLNVNKSNPYVRYSSHYKTLDIMPSYKSERIVPIQEPTTHMKMPKQNFQTPRRSHGSQNMLPNERRPEERRHETNVLRKKNVPAMSGRVCEKVEQKNRPQPQHQTASSTPGLRGRAMASAR
jgi:hypothetical protein